jgi:hypothetical protein
MAYNTGLFNVAAAPGQAVGQGLMGFGQAISMAGERQEEFRRRERREKREDERDALAKTLTLISVYDKMTAGLPPEQRQQVYTAGILPALVKTPGFESSDIGKMKDMFAAMALSDENDRSVYRDTLSSIIGYVRDGRMDDATERFLDIKSKFGNRPWAKGGLEVLGKMIENVRSIETEKLKERELRPERIRTAEQVAMAEQRIQEGRRLSPAEKEKHTQEMARLKFQADEAMKRLKVSAGAKDAERRRKEIDTYVDNTLKDTLKTVKPPDTDTHVAISGIYEDPKKGWVYDRKSKGGAFDKPETVMINVRSYETDAERLRTKLIEKAAAFPDRAIPDLAREVAEEDAKTGKKAEKPKRKLSPEEQARLDKLKGRGLIAGKPEEKKEPEKTITFEEIEGVASKIKPKTYLERRREERRRAQEREEAKSAETVRKIKKGAKGLLTRVKEAQEGGPIQYKLRQIYPNKPEFELDQIADDLKAKYPGKSDREIANMIKAK